MRLPVLTTLLALAGQSFAAALANNAPSGSIVSINPDGQTVTVPVLHANEYEYVDGKVPEHAFRVSPITDEDATALLLSGKGVAPPDFKETVTLQLSHDLTSRNGTQFLVTLEDGLVPELLARQQSQVLAGSAVTSLELTGRSLQERAKWGCLCCRGCIPCNGGGGRQCCWDICCGGSWDERTCKGAKCPWVDYC